MCLSSRVLRSVVARPMNATGDGTDARIPHAQTGVFEVNAAGARFAKVARDGDKQRHFLAGLLQGVDDQVRQLQIA